ncbi:hypothetical protein C1X21_20125 [Pseudomonas sp. FW305-3-2-15-A-LB2]|jgi:hypothetical protein|uniref:Uncharacterized protein n=1 Tax=Pseudomonas extremorientalis TaxID=169669 RepID=A0A1H0MBU7_9PSED|nr:MULTISPECIES: hypothetical protein [Pseudomonas]KAB0520818.1 hypothetical protein F7R08_06580 [Pseudomonas extremorientalis]OIN04720.1 hypothetical protein BFN10_26465 [Pseudomonas extremorientalis]PMV17574.1 hypothetical protein C1X17_29740 [Pseudomonas sp. FW305-3-2-15-C-TSA2]PMV22539.1 hypothetical protein C1X22_23925 [Pseudomonas sp. DP16D-L5]PMV37173.1 hypothetical protein C1X21_20125 [Pseudomonas sp. FW305-3-2-15-A-LB2]
MRPRPPPPFAYTSWMIALSIGWVFAGLAYGLKYAIEGSGSAAPHSGLDLALLLCGYLFLFCLKPIQKSVQRRLCRQTRQ